MPIPPHVAVSGGGGGGSGSGSDSDSNGEDFVHPMAPQLKYSVHSLSCPHILAAS